MPSITKKINSTEQNIITASEEIIIVSGTLTNITAGDITASIFIVRNNQRYSIIDDLMLTGKNYPPIVRRPENICTKLLLGSGDSLRAFAIPTNSRNYWQESTNIEELSNNFQGIIYNSLDDLATINLGYFPMEE